MKGKKVISEQDVLLFNMFRENMKGKVLSRDEMKKALQKELGYTNHDSMLKALTSGVNPPIVRVSRGKYQVSKEPVYIKRLQTAFDEYTHCANPRNYVTGSHMRLPSVEEAIKVLKDAGYRILKPITQYEEI